MLRDLLGFSKEPLELRISEAAKKFKEEKEAEMDAADEKAGRIRSNVMDEFEKTEEGLKELKGFEDSKNRQVINDVVDNIITDRIEMMEELSFPEDPEKLYEELDGFIEDFQSLTQKEGAVLEEAYLEKKVSRTIGGLETQREKLKEFLESEYIVVTNYEEIVDLLDRRESLLNEVDELQERIEELEVEKLKSKIDDIEGQLSELENSSEWNEYEELQEEVKNKNSERKQLVSDLKTSLSKMERGLKKLIYQVRNGDASVGRIDVLEKLQDKNIEYLLDNPQKTVKALEEAEESLPDDLLNDRQQKKFLESIDEVKDIPEISERIDSLESEVEELEHRIENHSVIREKAKLESERSSVQKQLEDERKRKENIEKRVNDAKKELEKVETEIDETMSDSFDREVKIEK